MDDPTIALLAPEWVIEAGSEAVLTALVRNCLQRCQFTWYVDGQPVAEASDEASGVAQIAGSAGSWVEFTAQSEFRHGFTQGVHRIRVVAVDVAGHVMSATAVVRAEALALPATDTEAPVFTRAAVQATGVGTLVAVLVGVVVGAFVLLAPRRRPMQPVPTPRQRRGRPPR